MKIKFYGLVDNSLNFQFRRLSSNQLVISNLIHEHIFFFHQHSKTEAFFWLHRCWRRNVLVTTITYFGHLFTNICYLFYISVSLCQVPAFKICHQHRKSVFNIVTKCQILPTKCQILPIFDIFLHIKICKCLDNSSLQSIGGHVFDVKIGVAVLFFTFF